jgi:hypothetical protein
VPSELNSESQEVFQSLLLSTALITQELKICTSLQFKELEADSTDSQLDPSEMFVSVQSKRVFKNSERKSIQLSSSDKEEPGEDLTELSFTSKTTPELLSIIKDKPKVAPSPVQSPKKLQNSGLKSHPTPDPSFEMI